MKKSIIEAKELSGGYAGAVKFSDVSFSVTNGQLLTVLGANGSGKTTLVKTLVRLLDPIAGILQINIENEEKEIAYIPQIKRFDTNFPARVIDFIVAGIRCAWPAIIRKSEKAVAIESLAKTGAEELLNSQINSLSGGQTQRVFLAAALAKMPKLLVMDEPGAGADIRFSDLIEDLIGEMKKNNTGIVLVSHNIDKAYAISDKVMLLSKKMIGCGSPEKIITKENISKLFPGFSELQKIK